MADDLDVLIIGAGLAGLAAACAAQDAGLRYVVIERFGIVQSLVQHPQQLRYFSPSDELAIGGIPFPMAGGHKPTREDALAYYRAVASARGLTLATWEEVIAVERDGSGGFRVRSETRVARPGIVTERRARYLIACTGTFQHPRRFGVPGDDLLNVLLHLDDPTPYFGRKVLVAGGGNSAATAAMTLAEAGAIVTVAMRREPVDFQSHLRPFIVRDLKIMAAERRLTLLTGVQVTQVLPDRVRLRPVDYGEGGPVVAGEAEDLETDFVFALIGQEAERDFFAMLGVPLTEDGLPVCDEHAETPVQGIYVAGSLSRANIILESRRRAVEIVGRIADQVKTQ